MNNAINPMRVRKALEALKQAQQELEAVLADAERPRPDPRPAPARIAKRRLKRLLDEGLT